MAKSKPTSKRVNPPNPTGKGGFQDHPELRNDGGRYPRGKSFTFWYNQFKSMTVAELYAWQDDNPKDVRTVVADLAFVRVLKARKDLKNFQEVANRSEGMPTQKTEISGPDEGAIELDTTVRETDAKLEEILRLTKEMYGGPRPKVQKRTGK